MTINSKYTDESKVNDEYWKSIGVNIERLKESKLVDVSRNFEKEIEKMKKGDHLEILSFFGVKSEEEMEKNELVSLLNRLDTSKKELFLKIKEFSLRKKRAVNNYYRELPKESRLYTNPIVQLLQLYSLSPSRLVEVDTYNSWLYRASDNIYTSNKQIPFDHVMKIATEKGYRDEICNRLFKASGESKYYDVFSYATIGENKVIILFYKQVNDKIVPDFKEAAIRNREVRYLLVEFDIPNSTLEIRDYSQCEKTTILEYIEETFDVSLTKVDSDVYYDYKVDKVKAAFLEGKPISGEKIDDFLVTKVFFKRSLLKNSPKLTFEVEYDDIWASIREAHLNGTIDLQSLKDIGSLSIKCSGMNRSIRTIVLDSGDVIFHLNDSNLDETLKSTIETKFKERFGLPLYQPISDGYFDFGLMDKVDYLMGLNQKESFDDLTKSLMDELVDKELIEVIQIELKVCPDCKREYKNLEEECLHCEVKLISKHHEKLKINEPKVLEFIESKLDSISAQLDDWDRGTDSNINIEGDQYRFFTFYNEEDDSVLRFLVTFEQLNQKVLNRIQRMLIPTVIIYVGENEKKIATNSQGCISVKNFGFFYAMDLNSQVNYFKSTVKDFILKAKHYISNAAYEALLKLEEAKDNFENYDAKQFEDDVYAIIKDITLNSKKWGSELSGKPVPEGVFALSYSLIKGTVQEKEQHVFTYDCKFSKRKDGYDLDIDEHRKAADYVKDVSTSDFVSNFSSINAVTAHIIISNNLKETKIKTMQKYFTEHVNPGLPTKTILLPLESLITLYRSYRSNFEDVARAQNHFKKGLIQLFNSGGTSISEADVKKFMKRATHSGLAEFDKLDVKEVTEDLVGQ
ncbi:hypothetical protein ABE402_01980 [Bacillus smithii]|uniref:hypothetical protein n=1 Tax=Bacillus smithii TaxID=1479 RepID=UPI003D251C32